MSASAGAGKQGGVIVTVQERWGLGISAKGMIMGRSCKGYDPAPYRPNKVDWNIDDIVTHHVFI